MTQPEPPQIQIDPTVAIDQLRSISGQVASRLMHDLAMSQTMLAQSQDEVARLTRINETLRSSADQESP